MTPDGQVFSGREAIRALHEFVFAGEFAGTDFLADVRRIVFLTGTVATVSLDVRVISPVQPTPVFFVRIQLVVVKQRGEWLIANQQITAVPPQPV